LVLESAFPLGLREAALLVPALPLALHAKLIAQAYDAKHTDHPSSSSHHSARPLALVALVLIVVVIVGLLLSSSPASSPCCAPSLRVLFASHTLVSAPSPFTNHHARPPLRGAPPSLYLLSRTTDKQADGRTHSQSDRQQVGNSESQETQSHQVFWIA
jgi:hypothetical protein